VCGRYSLAGPDPYDLRARFPIGEQVVVRRRFNVAPGDDIAAVTTDREGTPRGDVLRWGLVPHWAENPKLGARMINARAETVADKPAFRYAFMRRRCLILADGFFEWERPAPGTRRAWWVTRADRAPFAFAGLWSVWRPSGADGRADGVEPLRTCTIVTTTANPRVAAIHDRMPVILAPGGEDAWLDPATPPGLLHELLVPLGAAETAVRRVGDAVNDARHDEPDCLDPPRPEPEPAPALF
jgi:putative SOS response-associated peptidase YedK